MRIFKIMILLLAVFTVMGVIEIEKVTSSSELEILQKDGITVTHYNTADPVMIPINYIEKSEEFRGVWVATVWDIDIKYTDETQFKAAFQDLVDKVLGANMNAIVYQVRPQNDAYYDSDYAPWTRWITGTEGNDPGWDLMEYMINTCHANGIEFHAWLNPYRVANSSSSEATVLASLHSENFAKQRPDLVVAGNISGSNYPYILNPGEPEVKTFIRDVVKELITLYDVDGVHFDDYFYPSSGISSDTATYNTYKEVGQTIEDWRRENINDVVRGVKEDVDAHNTLNSKNVKFGISPSGVWLSGGAEGSNTSPIAHNSYDQQYADTKRWVEEEWVHYICPQIYRDFEHSLVPYADLVDWWASVARGTNVDLFIGHGAYLGESWGTGEIKDQLRYNQKHPEITGSVIYSAKHLNLSQMNDVVSDFWTILPTSAWQTSNVASPDIGIVGTKDGDVYTTDVTVTLTGVDDIYYKIEDGDWILYTTPLLFTTGFNALYTKAIDGASEESLVSSVNINIQKINNDIPDISITGDMIGGNYVIGSVVTITATEPIYVAINHGSVGDWVLYTGPITLDDDGGYFIRAKTIDSEGTDSPETTLSVTTQSACFADPIINIAGTGSIPSFQDATVSLSGESSTIFYKIDDGSWNTYSTPLVFDTEGEYIVYYKNDDECSVTLDSTIYIDQTVPNDPTIDIVGSFDGTYYTEEITVDLLTDDSANNIMYRLHNGSTWSSWIEFSGALDIIFNATYTIEYYTVDQALNESEIMSTRIKVKIPPNENSLFVVRDGNIVNYYGTSTPIDLPEDYTEKTEEIRAVWVATVSNIDIGLHYSEEDYKAKLINMLNTVEVNNFNTIFFQVRPMNDAFYPSSYAPYSRYLTGVEGGDPGWDVLAFLIEEAHNRGIEVHAWLNPYRVSSGTASKEDQLALLHDDNFAKQHPDLVIVDNSGKLILNPGEAQVQAYLRNVIQELISQYDIDGIHFDDYFYSYNGMDDSQDAETYNQNKEDGQSLDDWRRENVNTLVENVYNSIQTYNTNNDKLVKFGISPFGIWMSGGDDGSNTSIYALQSYKDQYADSKLWVEEGWVDYILPQLYWEFEHTAAPFADLVDWWAELCAANDVDLIVGHGFYRYDNDTWDDDDELLEQIRYIAQYDSVIGSAFFSYKTLLSLDSQVVQAMDRLNNYYWTEYATFPWESDVVKQVDPVCEADQELIDGECVDIVDPPVCEDNETLIDGQCVVDDEPIICDAGFEIIDDECVAIVEPPEDDNTVVTVVIVTGATISLGAILYFIRKFFFI